jgi:hypothetical protein
MYGPPLCRKRKVRIAGVVCAYVYGLVGVFNDPGLDGMRFALFLFNLSVFKDPYREQVCRTTVRPWCHLFLRQQTWQENLNSAAVARLRMWESHSDFQAWCSSRRHLQAGQMVLTASSGGL